MASEHSRVYRAALLELEQARYEAKLASRRYESVDPEQRLVAAELEARWNAALERVRDVERRLEELSQAHAAEVSIDRDKLQSLAESLPRVWNAPSADMRLKQRIVRMLILEIVVDVDAARSEIVLVVHWQGGRHTEIRTAKNRTGQHGRKASVDVEDVVRRMVGRWSNEDIAANLNRMGLRTGTGLSWNESRVHGLRHRMGLSSNDAASLTARHTLTLNDAVERLGVSNRVVLRLIQNGTIPAVQAVPNAPYEIPPDALEAPAVLAAVRRTRERGRHARDWARDRRTLTLPGIERNPAR
jgi:hypothetical protein